MLDDVLAFTENLPVRALAAGESLFREGDSSTGLFVLVEGELVVDTNGVVVNRLGVPGAFVGEIGALLGQGRTANVTAAIESSVRVIDDPRALFAAHPELGFEIARQLAGRLHRLTAYVSDVERQFGHLDDHRAMFGELLVRIASRPPVDIDPGSDRSPDS